MLDRKEALYNNGSVYRHDRRTDYVINPHDSHADNVAYRHDELYIVIECQIKPTYVAIA